MLAWILQWIAYVPVSEITRVAVVPAGTSTSNEPSSAVTVWSTLSELTIAIESPAFTVRALNLWLEIVSVFALPAAVVAPAAVVVAPESVVAPDDPPELPHPLTASDTTITTAPEIAETLRRFLAAGAVDEAGDTGRLTARALPCIPR